MGSGLNTGVGKDTLAIANVGETWTPSDRWKSGQSLEMEDFDVAIAELEAEGERDVHGGGLRDTVCHMAVIQDPDGNKLMIHKLKTS
jgi:hypothetical protein